MAVPRGCRVRAIRGRRHTDCDSRTHGYAESGKAARRTMADRTEELKATAAQSLALSRSTTDPRTRTNLLIMAQKLCDMENSKPGVFEKVQHEFNDQMLPPARL